MTSNLQLERRIARVQKQVDALPAVQPGRKRLGVLDDVSFQTLVDGDVVTWDGTNKLFTNKPGAAGSFPIGPFDDGFATHQIETITGGGIASTMTGFTQLDSDSGVNVGWKNEVETVGGQNLTRYEAEALVSTGTNAIVSVAAQSGSAQGAEAALVATNDTSVQGGISVAVQNGAHQPDIEVDAATTGSILLGLNDTVFLGFFGVMPAGQQTATTLPQVISALQAYGLLT